MFADLEMTQTIFEYAVTYWDSPFMSNNTMQFVDNIEKTSNLLIAAEVKP